MLWYNIERVSFKQDRIVGKGSPVAAPAPVHGSSQGMDEMNVEYTAQIWQEGDQFVAHAMPLDVMSAGRTPDEARKALDEAVHLFLVTAADMGTLDDVLQETGYELRNGIWAAPAWIAIERHSTMVAV